MKAKVMLINPPSSREEITVSDNYFPVGLLYLATVLKASNIDVKIIDIHNYFYLKEFDQEALNSYIENNLYPYIKDYRPDIIGIGCPFSGVFNNSSIE